MKKFEELKNDITYMSYQSKIDRVKEMLDDDESDLKNLDILFYLIEADRKNLNKILEFRKEQENNGTEENREEV